jgi:ribosomal protein L24E
MLIKHCPCCHQSFTTGTGFEADVYSDGSALEYCSAECAEHLEDEYQEYLDSCEV